MGLNLSGSKDRCSYFLSFVIERIATAYSYVLGPFFELFLFLAGPEGLGRKNFKIWTQITEGRLVGIWIKIHFNTMIQSWQSLRAFTTAFYSSSILYTNICIRWLFYGPLETLEEVLTFSYRNYYKSCYSRGPFYNMRLPRFGRKTFRKWTR